MGSVVQGSECTTEQDLETEIPDFHYLYPGTGESVTVAFAEGRDLVSEGDRDRHREKRGGAQASQLGRLCEGQFLLSTVHSLE